MPQPVSIPKSATRGLVSLPRLLRDRRQPLISWSFWLFAFIILLNLNGVVGRGLNVGQAFSLVLFAASVVILLTAGFAPMRDLGATGIAFYAFLIAYIGVGSIMNRFVSGVESFQHHLWMLSVAGLAVYVSAAASRHLLLSGPPLKTIRPLAMISMLTVGTVLLGKAWPGLYDLLPRSTEERHSGFFYNANNAGIAVNIAAAFCFAGVLAAKRRLPYIVAAGVCGLAAVLTFSRTAILIYMALLVGTVVMSQRGKRLIRSRSGRWWLLLGAALVAALFVWFLLDGVRVIEDLTHGQQQRIDNIRDLVHGHGLDEALSNRLPLFEVGWQYWTRRPILGNGLGVGTRMPGPELGTHNTWLLVLVDSGILPALLFAAFALIWLVQAWQCRIPSVRAVALGFFIVFWLSTMSSHTTLTKRTRNLTLGVVIGMMAADRELRRRQSRLQRNISAAALAHRGAGNHREIAGAAVAGD